jgi:hypothetical protein
MTNETKTLDAQLAVAREIMERRRAVLAAAKARLETYRSKPRADRGE